MKPYELAVNIQGTPVIIPHGPGPLAFRPGYTRVEAQQVVDWLNGDDQPLQDMVALNLDSFAACLDLGIHPTRSTRHYR
jgi:hypothetical protein